MLSEKAGNVDVLQQFSKRERERGFYCHLPVNFEFSAMIKELSSAYFVHGTNCRCVVCLVMTFCEPVTSSFFPFHVHFVALSFSLSGFLEG